MTPDRTQGPVAQICNLLFRRIAFGRSLEIVMSFNLSAISGLQIRDPAECNSAATGTTGLASGMH